VPGLQRKPIWEKQNLIYHSIYYIRYLQAGHRSRPSVRQLCPML
jgi:hypothetical protein